MGKSKVNSEVVKAAVKAVQSSSDSSSSSSSDSDKKKTVAKPAAKATATPAKRKSSSSSSSSSDSDSDKKKKVAPAAKKSPAAKPVATPAKKAKSSSSSDSSSDSDSDKKKPAVAAKAKSPAAKPVATPAKKAASSSSSSSSDSDSDKKKPAAAKAKSPAAKPQATPAKKAASSSSSSSSDSDEEMKQAPAAPAAAKRKRESSSSSSSSSSDSDDDKPAAKAAPKDDFTALKKQKTENGSVAVVTANGGASNTIFVGGLSFDAGEEDVKAFFQEFGEIKTVRIPVHSDTGRKKGMAFVEFADPAAAAAAVSKDQAEMMGRWLNVSLSTSGTRPSAAPRTQELSEKPAGCKTVFVGNLSWQASEDDLRAAFAECGSINNVRIAWDQENDRSKGFGHVEFDDESAVDLAVKCAGKEVAGRAIRVDYAPVREGRKSFGGGDRGGRGGRGGGFGGRGGAGGRGGGFGGRGGRGGASTPMNKNKATMGGFSGKKVSFD